MALTYPSLLPGVFAEGAANHETIPDTGADEGRMAWDVGFPSETSLPISIGGVPPRRLDMNGLGNRISQHVFWQQSGGLYSWDADLDYPAGAHILGSNGVEYIAIQQSGPSQTPGVGAVDPTTDVNGTVWKSFARTLADIIYPVGSIYMSVQNVSPATLFGGSWTKIQGCFLLASSNSYANGTTGGSTTHSLTVSEMPSHTHTITVQNSTGHTHGATSANAGTHSHSITVDSAGSHKHSVTVVAKTVAANTGSSGVGHTHTVVFPKTTFADAAASAGTHSHGRGTLNITGTFDADDFTNDSTKPTATGAFSYFQSATRRDAENGSHKGYGLSFSAKDGWSGKLADAGSHKHNVTIAKTTMTSGDASTGHTHSISITVPAQSPQTTSAGDHTHPASSADNGSHKHSITVQTGGVHTHTANAGTTGSNVAFSVMPPYLSVNVWKRTA